jgi:hypothetical protein
LRTFSAPAIRTIIHCRLPGFQILSAAEGMRIGGILPIFVMSPKILSNAKHAAALLKGCAAASHDHEGEQ